MQSNSQPFLASFASRPLLIAVDAADFFKASVQFVVNHEYADAMIGQARPGIIMSDEEFWDDSGWVSALRPYVVHNGVLQVPVQGTLLNRFPYQLGRWATGYDYIERAVARGIADPEVRAIALVVDSYGGEVSGCFELVGKLVDFGEQKPIKAFVADHGYSAAYAISSAAEEIVVTPSGGTGSVGVVTVHFSYADAMDKMGVKVTFIHAGKHKVDGNMYEDLPDSVKDRIQARVDKSYGIFTSTVAKNRAMSEDDVRGTEALMYDADDSIDIGFADRIGALEDEMIAFTEEVSDAEDEQMTTKTNTNGSANPTEDTVAKATYDADVAKARADGEAAGQKSERDRMTAILGSDAGKARPKAAMSAVLKTDMSADDAVSFLEDLPEEKAEAKETETSPEAQTQNGAGNGFNQAMTGTDNPGVGANVTDGDDDNDTETDSAESIVADFKAITGVGMNKKSA